MKDWLRNSKLGNYMEKGRFVTKTDKYVGPDSGLVDAKSHQWRVTTTLRYATVLCWQWEHPGERGWENRKIPKEPKPFWFNLTAWVSSSLIQQCTHPTRSLVHPNTILTDLWSAQFQCTSVFVRHRKHHAHTRCPAEFERFFFDCGKFTYGDWWNVKPLTKVQSQIKITPSRVWRYWYELFEHR